MRVKSVAGLTGVFILALASSALTQTKGRPAKGTKPPPSSASGADATKAESAKPDTTPSAPAEGAPATGGASSSATTSGDDFGAPPPKAGAETPTQRRSPLTPEPNEFPQGAPKAPPIAYDKLLSDIAALRGRVAAVTTTLFSSKLRVLVGVEGDDARIAAFRVTLDDGVVYSAPERLGGDEPQVVYEHAVAPGHHLLGVEIERYDARNREYRTFQSSKFTVIVPEGQRLETSLRIEDDSDMADDFPGDQDGEYDLRVRLRARVVN